MADPTDISSFRKRFQLTAKGRIVYFSLAAAALGLFGYSTSTAYVRPNEFGIKQVVYGANKGIRKDVYLPGLHFVAVGMERMHRFPTDVQTLNMTGEQNQGSRDDFRASSPLNIQTSEGYNVTVDISVLYRIVDPYKVIVGVGPGKLYEDSLVMPRANQVLRKNLGALDAEEFYDVKKRTERVNRSVTDLDAELNPSGIDVLNVFVRMYTYDQRYQHAIEQRKIQDQSVFKNIAEADMAAANAEKDRIVAVGDAQVKVELARGDAEKSKLESEAELYERKQRAGGELQLKLAEAEGTRLANDALRGSGSEAMVGLRMAEVLKGTRVVVIPTDGPSGFNPLDLQTALKRFDVRE